MAYRTSYRAWAGGPFAIPGGAATASGFGEETFEAVWREVFEFCAG